MEILGYLSAIFMGLALGMTGGGGSILTVPILVYLFLISPVQAISYSLFVVGLTALVGGALAYRRGEVDLKTGFIFAVPSFIGVYVSRHFVVPLLPDPVFTFGNLIFSKSLFTMMIFSMVMLLASISMIKGRKQVQTLEMTSFNRIILIASRGILVGFITGFVGAGGGFLIVPALVVLLGLDMKKAVGTSLLIIASNSLIGFLGDLQNQSHTDWQMLLTIVFIAIVGLFVGMKLARKITEKNLKKGFGIFVLIMAAMILLDQVRKL